LPGYIGVWRLLVPLSGLGGSRRRAPEDSPATTRDPEAINAAVGSVNGYNGLDHKHDNADRPSLMLADGHQIKTPAELIARAGELAGLINGDVGTLDSGIDPILYFISAPIKGAKRALKLRHSLEQRFDLTVEFMPDVEYERRRSTRFDWSRLASEPKAVRLVSDPINTIGEAMAALARLPGNTVLGAMTTMLVDFNCADQLFHLVTAPLHPRHEPRRVKRTIEKQTGASFEIVRAEAGMPRPGAGT
jgi:hypothetical protein